MTTGFEQRERAFEAKYAHDEEFRYLVRARRDRLFGEWAATMAALPPAQAEALVAEILHLADGPAPDGSSHDDAVIGRGAETLARHHHVMTRPELAAILGSCDSRARTERLAEPLDHPEAP